MKHEVILTDKVKKLVDVKDTDLVGFLFLDGSKGFVSHTHEPNFFVLIIEQTDSFPKTSFTNMGLETHPHIYDLIRDENWGFYSHMGIQKVFVFDGTKEFFTWLAE